jgi:hypothetical protein
MMIDTTEAAHGGSGLREGDAGIISCWRGKSDRLLEIDPKPKAAAMALAVNIFLRDCIVPSWAIRNGRCTALQAIQFVLATQYKHYN